MQNKGIFWALELGIGLLVLITLAHAFPIASISHAPELAFQLCLDLQEMWVQGEDVHSIISTYFSDKIITISDQPILSQENMVICEATRVRDGVIETQVIGIQP